MTRPAIKVEGLCKEYAVGQARQRHGTFYDLLSHSLQAPLRRLRSLGDLTEARERFWALRDVSFEIQPGEVVGVIGRNGAGKSTLLKILSRITPPTKGKIEVRGRLASLLEVGTGFHPELSGRENIFLNGAILGMRRSEVARKFDEIVAFAEVEKFIDTPVKRYSSGMYVRLAFSVAAHLEPDVLIVDEVLAVGDASFQRKCLGKLEATHRSGRAVIVVSHHMPMITQLCSKALWLDRGEAIVAGDVRSVAARYLSSSRHGQLQWVPAGDATNDFHYQRVSIVASDGHSSDAISASSSFYVELCYVVRAENMRGRIAMQIRDQYDTPIFSSANTDGTSSPIRIWARGEYVESCEIPGNLLAPGTYFLTVSSPSTSGDLLHENICGFKIDSVDSLVASDGRDGCIAPLLKWRYKK